MIDPEKAINYVIEKAPEYAQAKAERRYIEGYLKVVKAEVFQEAAGTMAEKEAHAYAHERYKEQLDGLRAAVEREEELLWRMKAAMEKVELYRTQEASARFVDKSLAGASR